jgi:hypothetical protein
MLLGRNTVKPDILAAIIFDRFVKGPTLVAIYLGMLQK